MGMLNEMTVSHR